MPMFNKPVFLQLLKGALLLCLALLIWLLDRAWALISPDAVVIIAVLPLAYLMARKHPMMEAGKAELKLSPVLVIGCSLILLGIFFGVMTFMAFGWGCLCTELLLARTQLSRPRLILLCAGAFPWVLMDFNEVGWFFRLSGADVTAFIYSLTGHTVNSDGTFVVVDGLLVSVEAACSGMELLQVLISGGVGLALIQYPKSRIFWTLVAALPILAWISNCVRIVVITFWALHFGIDAASGTFHTWGALVVLCTMLSLFIALSKILKTLVRALDK